MKTTTIIKRASLLLILSGMAAVNATAQTNYYWNPGANGNGTWDASGTVWAPDLTGSDTMARQPDTADNAYFAATGVTPGTVTVVGSQTFGNLYLNQAGWLFTGGTLVGKITVNASGTVNSYRVSGANIVFETASQSLTLSGGGGFNTGNATFGNQRATAQLVLASGSYNSNSYLNIGSANNLNTGLVINTGATLTGASWVGYGGGLATINGGLMSHNGGLVVGRGGSPGRVIINSGTLLNTAANNPLAGGVTVGMDGSGVIDVQGGALDTKALNIMRVNTANGVSGYTGLVNLTSGTISAEGIYFGAGSDQYGNAGAGYLNVSGGVLKVGASGIVNASAESSGTNGFQYAIILGGGTVTTTGAAGWSSALDMTVGGVTFDTDKDIALSGVLSGAGGFTKAGGGTLLLSGANTYDGDTIVSAGTLQLNDALSLGGVADLLINSGASVNLNYSGVATIDSLLLDGVTISNLVIGQSYNYNELNTALGATIFSGGGLLSVSTIPEPSTWTLLLTGAALLAVMRRRR